MLARLSLVFGNPTLEDKFQKHVEAKRAVRHTISFVVAVFGFWKYFFEASFETQAAKAARCAFFRAC
jgi:hypothetical protein